MDFDAIRLTSLLLEGVWVERIVRGLAFLFLGISWGVGFLWEEAGDGKFSSFGGCLCMWQ